MTNYFCSFGGNGGGLTRENHPINMMRDMSGRNDHGEGDGQAHQSQVQDQASCKRLRLSGRNGNVEGDSLASQSLVQENGSHKAVRRSQC